MSHTRRAALLLWISTLVVPFAFLALAGTARWRGECPAPPALVFSIAVMVASLSVVLSRLVPPRIPPARAGREATTFTRLLIGWALCEVGALFPLVAWIVSGDQRLIGVFGAVLLALVLLYPSEQRWESLAPPPGPPEGRVG